MPKKIAWAVWRAAWRKAPQSANGNAAAAAGGTRRAHAHRYRQNIEERVARRETAAAARNTARTALGGRKPRKAAAALAASQRGAKARDSMKRRRRSAPASDLRREPGYLYLKRPMLVCCGRRPGSGWMTVLSALGEASFWAVPLQWEKLFLIWERKRKAPLLQWLGVPYTLIGFGMARSAFGRLFVLRLPALTSILDVIGLVLKSSSLCNTIGCRNTWLWPNTILWVIDHCCNTWPIH